MIVWQYSPPGRPSACNAWQPSIDGALPKYHHSQRDDCTAEGRHVVHGGCRDSSGAPVTGSLQAFGGVPTRLAAPL